MIITHRTFIIPESIEEKELLDKDRKFRKQTSYINNKSINYYTNSESDADIIRLYGDKIKQLYSFQILNVKHINNKKTIQYIKKLKIRPTIIIDTRTGKKVLKNQDFDLKQISNSLGLMYYSIPKLSSKTKRKIGFKILTGLMAHKKMLFIGTNDNTLNIVQEYMNNKTDVI